MFRPLMMFFGAGILEERLALGEVTQADMYM
jgi:hypothetical protein